MCRTHTEQNNESDVNSVESGDWTEDRSNGDWVYVEDPKNQPDGSIVCTLRNSTNYRIQATGLDMTKYYRKP